MKRSFIKLGLFSLVVSGGAVAFEQQEPSSFIVEGGQSNGQGQAQGKSSFIIEPSQDACQDKGGASSSCGQVEKVEKKVKKVKKVSKGDAPLCDKSSQLPAVACDKKADKSSQVVVAPLCDKAGHASQEGQACSSSFDPFATAWWGIGANVKQASCSQHGVEQGASQCGLFAPKGQFANLWLFDFSFGHHLTYSNWGGLQLSDTHLNARLRNVVAKGAKLYNVEINGAFGKDGDKRRKWTNIDLDNSQINQITFTNITLKDVDFRHATIHNTLFDNVHFHRKHLSRSNFDHATLTNVTFKNSHLAHVTFRGAMLKNVSLACSDIAWTAHFEGAKIYNNQTDGWDTLTGNDIRNLQGHMSSCQQDYVNLSAWWNDLPRI